MPSRSADELKTYLSHLGDNAGQAPSLEEIRAMGHHRQRRASPRVLVAMAAALLLVVAGGLFASRSGNSQVVTVADESTGTTAEAGPSSTQRTTTTPTTTTPTDTTQTQVSDQSAWDLPPTISYADPPPSFVSVGSDGVVRRFDTVTGDLIQVVGSVPFDTPSELRAWTVPGALETLAASCCEPVSGNIYSFDGGSVEGMLRYVGRRGVPSPDGRLVLLIQPSVGLAIDGDAGYELLANDPLIDGTEAAWLRTEQGVVVMRSRNFNTLPGSNALTDVALGHGSLAQARAGTLESFSTGDQLGRMTLAVSADDHVLVAGCSDERCVTSTVLSIDLGTGEISRSTVDYHLMLGGYDPTGTYLMATDLTAGQSILIHGSDPQTAVRIQTDQLSQWSAW